MRARALFVGVRAFAFLLAPIGCELPRDGTLTLADVQVRGTHNSYHVASADPIDASADYTQPPLPEQLGALGVRQLELDIHKRIGGTVEVLHVPILDEQSTCLTLLDCLAELARFSDEHPRHLPIVVWLEPKDLFALDSTLESLLPHHALVADIVLSALGRDRLLTPSDVQRDHATLADAVRADGWPTLGALRGKVLLAWLDEDQHRARILDDGALSQLFFVRAQSDDQPFSALLKIDDVRGREAEVARLSRAGFVITSTGDEAGAADNDNDARRALTLSSGAHAISSDFPSALDVDGAGGPWRCHPLLTSPNTCGEADLEPD